MLAPAMDDDLFGAIGTEPSEYQRMAEEKRMQRVLDAQIRKYGDDAMRVDPKMKLIRPPCRWRRWCTRTNCACPGANVGKS